MKKLFKNLPISLKLTSAIVAASFLVLILFSGAFFAVEIYFFRSSMVDEISVTANLLSANARPVLLSRKQSAAAKTLTSLSAQPYIRSAYLFDISGKPLGQYLDRTSIEFTKDAIAHDFTNRQHSEWLNSQKNIIHFGWKHLSVFAPIFDLDNNKIGTLYLLSDNSSLYNRIHGLVLGLLLGIGALVPFSLFIARYLTRPIADPLLNLADKMATISSSNDFSVRAYKRGGDEIGDLVDGFNDMLTQIEIRDGRLSDHQKYLQETVSHRTSELQETVSQLEESKKLAETANHSKSQFLANITHELRTPLIGVLGMNELLVRTELDDHQRSLVETVQRSGEDLLAMISDILDFSKIESGHMNLETIDVDIFKIVEETAHLLAEKAQKKGLLLTCEVSADAMWKVQSDAVRIRQILLNLIGNAVKFTTEGEIAVRLGMTALGQGLGCFKLEVEDTGVGMSDDEKSNIFSAFVQADSTTTRKYGGTGLGLSIVHQLVEMMGGTLSLETCLGQGSLFRVELTLPLVSNVAPRLPDSLRGRRILLFDQTSSERDILHAKLSQLGMQVVVADLTEDAWYQLLAGSRQENPYDFAFIPIDSAFSDGSSLYQKINMEALLSGLRMIVTCPQSSLPKTTYPEDLQILDKPVSWSSLVHCLVRSWKKIELVSTSPVAQPIKQTEPTLVQQIPSNLTHFKILLAEDNAVTRELVCLSLQRYPIEIDQVVSGTEVLQALERKTYDLILMDCNMPELDGIETTRRMRLQGCHHPVIALTAHADKRILDSCMDAGMNDLLRKPFRQIEIHDMIEKWLAPVLNTAPIEERLESAAMRGEE